eukprot:jgi/Chlat1/1519/Chrsp120S01796
MGGPYRAGYCSDVRLSAVASVDACRAEQSLTWDLHNDGEFDDAIGHKPTFNAYKLGLGSGVHTISVRASSNACPDSPPEVVSTTVNVTIAPLVIRSVEPYIRSGNRVASVAENIYVTVQSSKAVCKPDNLTIDCGPGSVSVDPEYCRYSSPGIKTISVTIAQFGVVASRSVNTTVTTFK